MRRFPFGVRKPSVPCMLGATDPDLEAVCAHCLQLFGGTVTACAHDLRASNLPCPLTRRCKFGTSLVPLER